jgi:hypothetical protein
MKKHLKYLFFIHRISHTKGYNNPLYIKKTRECTNIE